MTVGSSGMQVFGIFRDQKVSVDVVATSEISISLTLDPRRAAALARQPQRGWVRPACKLPLPKWDAKCLKRPLADARVIMAGLECYRAAALGGLAFGRANPSTHDVAGLRLT